LTLELHGFKLLIRDGDRIFRRMSTDPSRGGQLVLLALYESQNAVYPHTKGTMRFQKLTLLWMLKENGKI